MLEFSKRIAHRNNRINMVTNENSVALVMTFYEINILQQIKTRYAHTIENTNSGRWIHVTTCFNHFQPISANQY